MCLLNFFFWGYCPRGIILVFGDFRYYTCSFKVIMMINTLAQHTGTFGYVTIIEHLERIIITDMYFTLAI
jgi:hypothetical protein